MGLPDASLEPRGKSRISVLAKSFMWQRVIQALLKTRPAAYITDPPFFKHRNNVCMFESMSTDQPQNTEQEKRKAHKCVAKDKGKGKWGKTERIKKKTDEKAEGECCG